jgi:hypothetical protein
MEAEFDLLGSDLIPTSVECMFSLVHIRFSLTRINFEKPLTALVRMEMKLD